MRDVQDIQIKNNMKYNMLNKVNNMRKKKLSIQNIQTNMQENYA